jgi:hypothetical protein
LLVESAIIEPTKTIPPTAIAKEEPVPKQTVVTTVVEEVKEKIVAFVPTKVAQDKSEAKVEPTIPD